MEKDKATVSLSYLSKQEGKFKEDGKKGRKEEDRNNDGMKGDQERLEWQEIKKKAELLTRIGREKTTK